MATPGSGFSVQSRSPRSLQSRNTKNLSLSIQDSSLPAAGKLENGQIGVPSGGAKPISIGGGRMKSGVAGRPLQSRRTEASIYSLPADKRSGSMSPRYSSSVQRGADMGGRVSRVHSLSVKTKELDMYPVARERARTLNSAFDTSTPKMGGSEADTDPVYADAFKGDAYPVGPLLVIPPNVYLYSEPDLEEILNFDVVVNVAKELPNLMELVPQSRNFSYHHVKWGHNSKISNDLEDLTNLVHVASTGGKKVLVHCQCGVSRSASLIVAYIMRYHNMGLNEAYSHVKAIAKDISPNMSLIFQLMEWNEVYNKNRKESEKTARSPYQVPISAASPTNDLTFVSPESPPRTPGEYFNKVSASSSASSASTSSSTIVANQTQAKPISLPSDLEDYLPTAADVTAPPSAGDYWG